jgi:hypothetical protein
MDRPLGTLKYSPFAGDPVSKSLEGKISCLEKCLQDGKVIDCELIVTGARENSHAGGADGPHGRGNAFDFSLKKNPDLDGKSDEIRTCYEKCFDKDSSYAQEEANPPHFHIKILPERAVRGAFPLASISLLSVLCIGCGKGTPLTQTNNTWAVVSSVTCAEEWRADDPLRYCSAQADLDGDSIPDEAKLITGTVGGLE